MLFIILPYPPSVNTYWGFKGSHRFLTKKAKEFKEIVHWRFLQTKHKGFGKKRLTVSIVLHAPDKRIRDLDNSIKSLLDACCQAGMFADDSQIDKITVERGAVTKGGLCHLFIEENSFIL